jgi:hypothetical protein
MTLESWDEKDFEKMNVTDMETARMALSWAVGQIHSLQDSLSRLKGDLQDKEGKGKLLQARVTEAEASLRQWEEKEKAWKREL